MTRKPIPALPVLLIMLVPATCRGLSITEKPIGEALRGIPEEVVWSPRGESVLLSIIDDNLNRAAVSEINVETGERGDYPLSGPIRAFAMNPDGSMLATIHEDRRDRVLQVWDTPERTPKEIFRDGRNLYFPVVNTVYPWDPTGKRLVFYGAMLHLRDLFVWEAGGEVVDVTSERRSDRAFWDPAGRLLVPQGVRFEAVMAGEPDLLSGLVEIEFPEMGESLRELPEKYTNIFPYSRPGKAILKDKMVSPLLLDLVTWETFPLPESLDRYLDVTWSPDGSKLAYPLIGRNYNRILTFDAASGETRLLWVDENFLAGSLDWSPSGEYLALSVLKAAGPPEAEAVVIEADTGKRVWSRSRDPAFVRRYFERGRKALRWHPSKDTLLLWDPREDPEEAPAIMLRVIEFGE